MIFRPRIAAALLLLSAIFLLPSTCVVGVFPTKVGIQSTVIGLGPDFCRGDTKNWISQQALADPGGFFHRSIDADRFDVRVRRECELSISIGGSHVTFALTHQGNILESLRIEGRRYETALKSANAYLQLLLTELTVFLDAHGPLTLQKVLIGAPGIIRNGVVLASVNTPLTGVALAQIVHHHLIARGQRSDLKVQFENDILHEAGDVPSVSLILSVGTGISIGVIDTAFRESLEFGMTPLPLGKTVENAFKAAKTSQNVQNIIKSFFNPLVALLEQSGARYLILTGGVSDMKGFIEDLKAQLEQAGLARIVILKKGQTDPVRGFFNPAIDDHRSLSYAMFPLRRGLDIIGRISEAILQQEDTVRAKKLFQTAMASGGWLDLFAHEVTVLEHEVNLRGTWSALEWRWAGLLNWQLRHGLSILEQVFTRIHREMWERFPNHAVKWRGWYKRIHGLMDRQKILADIFSGAHLAPREAWRKELILSGLSPLDVGPLALHVFPRRTAPWKSLAINARDFRQLAKYRPRWRLQLEDNQPDRLRLIVGVPQEGMVRYKSVEWIELLVIDGEVWLADGLLESDFMGMREREWLQNILFPWLLERGFDRLVIGRAKPNTFRALGVEWKNEKTKYREGSTEGRELRIHLPTYLATRAAA